MRIGISIRSVEVNNKESYVLYKRYIDYFKNDEIVLIHPTQSLEILRMCDVFILTGGDDLNPKLYNQKNINSNSVDDEMDELDFKIIKYAYLTNKKLLGICRGIQSINVFFKGTLKQHHDNHMDVTHQISLKNKSRFFKYKKKYIVNSYHHQTIDKIGDDLSVVYVSDDNIIEVIEHKTKNILAVQYHPEINAEKHSKILFDFLKIK